jgi:hypothetical protein
MNTDHQQNQLKTHLIDNPFRLWLCLNIKALLYDLVKYRACTNLDLLYALIDAVDVVDLQLQP